MIPPALRPRLEFAAKAFLVTAFCGTLVAGALRLRHRAVTSAEHWVDLSDWAVRQRPSWTSLDDVRAIRAGSGLLGRSMSFYDRGSAQTVAALLAHAPSVKRVAGLRRVAPNQLEAVLEVRVPAVAVRLGGPRETYVVCDDEGVVLGPPVGVRPQRDGRPLRVVTGAAGPLPRPGGRLGADVVAAAELSGDLDGFADAKGRDLLYALDRIDVANWGGRVRPGTSEIALASLAAPPVPTPGAKGAQRSGVVEWGRAGPRADDAGEPPFAAKAQRLLQALRLFPRLIGLKTAKVAFDELIVVPDGAGPPQLARALEIERGVQAK